MSSMLSRGSLLLVCGVVRRRGVGGPFQWAGDMCFTLLPGQQMVGPTARQRPCGAACSARCIARRSSLAAHLDDDPARRVRLAKRRKHPLRLLGPFVGRRRDDVKQPGQSLCQERGRTEGPALPWRAGPPAVRRRVAAMGAAQPRSLRMVMQPAPPPWRWRHGPHARAAPTRYLHPGRQTSAQAARRGRLRAAARGARAAAPRVETRRRAATSAAAAHTRASAPAGAPLSRPCWAFYRGVLSRRRLKWPQSKPHEVKGLQVHEGQRIGMEKPIRWG
jgi:hypothetical protein